MTNPIIILIIGACPWPHSELSPHSRKKNSLSQSRSCWRQVSSTINKGFSVLHWYVFCVTFLDFLRTLFILEYCCEFPGCSYLSSRDTRAGMETLKTLLVANGHDKDKVFYLKVISFICWMLLLIIHFFWDHKAATCVTKMTKVDIEGSELGALPEWIESGALEKVDPKTCTKRETCYGLGRLHIWHLSLQKREFWRHWHLY